MKRRWKLWFDLCNCHRIFCFLHLSFDINYLYFYIWMSEGCWCADHLFILTWTFFIFYFYYSAYVFNRQFFTFLLLPSFWFYFMLLFKYYRAIAISFLFSSSVMYSTYFFILFRYRFWTLQFMSWFSCVFFPQDFDNSLGIWSIFFLILKSSRS